METIALCLLHNRERMRRFLLRRLACRNDHRLRRPGMEDHHHKTFTRPDSRRHLAFRMYLCLLDSMLGRQVVNYPRVSCRHLAFHRRVNNKARLGTLGGEKE